jgi:hypothetical protein
MLSGNDLRTLQLIFPAGEAGEEFEELIGALATVATAITDRVNIDTVVTTALADD